MPAATNELDRFLRTLHRRMVAVRAVESAGLGALAACAVALLLIPVLIWRGQPPLPAVVAVVFLGAAGGLAWSLSRRPTRLRAAMEADRQLGLADLLGTAVGVRGGSEPTDPWRRTVLALAEARCQQHRPSEVLLNRFGARAWGGIGLAAALVVTLAALPGFPTGADASSGGRPAVSRLRVTTGEPERPAFADSAHRSPRETGAAASPGRTGDEPESLNSAEAPDDGSASETRSTAPDGRGRDTAGDPNGAGGGAAKARRPRESEPPAVQQGTAAADRPTPPAEGGAGGGGGASKGDSDKTNPTRAAATSGGSNAPVETPPWQSDSWPQDVRRAREATESGRIPDAYRDLVRDYFERP